MSLYSVRFTTKKIVTKYGPKREVLSEELLEIPIVLNGLPLATAQSYAHCDNFVMTQDTRGASGATVSYRKTRGGKTTREVSVAPVSRRDRAAATGDMGAAL